MKYICASLFIAVILAAACSKNNTSNAPPEEPDQEISIQVLEKETNKPISAATVLLQKCSNYDFEFGCQSYATIRTLLTNDSGKVHFKNSLHVDQIEVHHSKYWTALNGNPAILTPIATIKALIKKTHTHPDTAVLSIAAHPADCYYPCMLIFQTIGLPADTVVYFKGWGYSDNEISWYTTTYQQVDSIFDTGPIHINGFDTVPITIPY